MSTNAPTPVNGFSDEIDLFELAQNLWKQKLLIISVTVMVTALAAAYAFLSAPVYESKSSILPPRLADIAGYNIGRSETDLPEFTIKKIYSAFIQNLRSEEIRHVFLNKIYLHSELVDQNLSSKYLLLNKINRSLSVSNPDVRNTPERFEVKVQLTDALLAAKWVNMFVELVEDKTRQDMVDALNSELDARVALTKSRISFLRERATKLRRDRIARLSEALKIADQVGLLTSQVNTNRIASDAELEQFVDGNLMYMRGAKSIRAELDVLQNRKDDDPFIVGLRDLENQLDFLAKVSVSPDDVKVFTLDRAAQIAETPIKPKKAFILALGLVLGGMLGILIALIRSVLVKGREQVV